jgi:negative regulator of genetic competence, sporulation and motility
MEFIDEEIGSERFFEVILEKHDIEDLEKHGMAYLSISTKKKHVEVSVRFKDRPVSFQEEE